MIENVTVLGERYNIAQAPALQQKDLLLLLGARVSLRVAANGGNEIDTGTLVGTLLTFSESEVDKISSILLPNCYLQGAQKPAELGDFQGRIHGYFVLLAEAVKVNLNPFFGWLASEISDSKEQVSTNKPA